MADGITEIAMMFKERENVKSEFIVVGKVLQTAPLKVADGAEISVDEGDELIVTKTIKTLIQSGELKIDDKVLMISDNGKYAAIDKVV
ncbi:hypothetical protein [Lysinibacillus fusiformis]|nr:hypothetical protein [Lysinibacillus fusiformis]